MGCDRVERAPSELGFFGFDGAALSPAEHVE